MIFIKTIGIIIRDFKENKKEFIGTRYDLFQILSNYKVKIIGIPITISWSKMKEIVDTCDGIVLSGGDKFLTNDFRLVKYLYKKDIPTLGICLGMQAMAETFNKKDEISVSNHNSNAKYVHEIIINKGSLLYEIIHKNKIRVNSRHRTAVTHTKLQASAVNGNIIEAVEDENKRFFLGLQWHPETINDRNSKRIFKYFVDSL